MAHNINSGTFYNWVKRLRAKANELDLYKYLRFLFEYCLNADIPDENLQQFAPWSELVQKTCK